MKNTCGNCGYAVKITDAQNLTGVHECHALPPQLIVIPVRGVQGVGMAPAVAWPNVNPDTGWCGAHTPIAPKLAS